MNNCKLKRNKIVSLYIENDNEVSYSGCRLLFLYICIYTGTLIIKIFLWIAKYDNLYESLYNV